jgi:hypothetical protein
MHRAGTGLVTARKVWLYDTIKRSKISPKRMARRKPRSVGNHKNFRVNNPQQQVSCASDLWLLGSIKMRPKPRQDLDTAARLNHKPPIPGASAS